MKTRSAAPENLQIAPIVTLAEKPLHLEGPGHAAMSMSSPSLETPKDPIAKTRAFAEPFLAHECLDTGENALVHADGVNRILQTIGAGKSLRAVVYLVYVGDYLSKPEEIIRKAFGEDEANLVGYTRRLVQIQRNARDALGDEIDLPMWTEQIERVRKMLLAFSKDLRVVLLRLASRLQTLRYYASEKKDCPKVLAQESLQVFAPLANRLGIWQIKWQIEDLAFRFLQPLDYQGVAALLDEKRSEREAWIESARAELHGVLLQADIQAQVQGRSKHLYSIWKKMQNKSLGIERVFDLRALRVIVSTVSDCYAALAKVHEWRSSLTQEFDDYIARPKPNGYQSLHTVVVDTDGRFIEVQIRTQGMHEHAESGVAAHWAYKEAGVKGYKGVAAEGDFESQIAQARKAVLQQLLAWERDISSASTQSFGLFDDRIYVFTPQGAIIELPTGATPIDFAYAIHTDLGHRCRGARVDGGALIPLNTPLKSGQTIDIIAAREGAPSRDWLSPDLAYLRSNRAKAKVRAWFNALLSPPVAPLGKTGPDKASEAHSSSHSNPRTDFDDLKDFKDTKLKNEGKHESKGAVLVMGMDSLLTQLAKCCKPAPPDAICGFITRGKGVSIHRNHCSNYRQLSARLPERTLSVSWSQSSTKPSADYAVDTVIDAVDRPNLLKEITEIFAKDRLYISALQSQRQKQTQMGMVHMTLTLQVTDAAVLDKTLAKIKRLEGVRVVHRK